MFAFGGSATQNYPAGSQPWSGTPTRVDPSIRYLTPGAACPAQFLNYVFGSLCDAAGLALTVPGAGWNPQATSFPSSLLPTGAAYDPYHFQWLVCTSAAGGAGACDVVSSRGAGDSDFASVSNGAGVSSAGVAQSALFDGTDYYMATVNASGQLTVYECAPGAAWGNPYVHSGFAYTGNLELVIFGSNIFTVGGTSTFIFLNATAVGGGGSAWTSAVSGISQACTAGVLVAQNGTALVVFPKTASPAHYGYTTTPISSMTTTSASFLAATNETPYGLAWSAADVCFVLITFDSSNTFRAYQSPDGLSWTNVATLTTLTTPNGLACTPGGTLVTEIRSGSLNNLLFSIDAGVSWHFASPTLTGGSSLTPGKVAGSPAQLCALTNAGLRFSHCAGLSPAVT